MISKTWQVDLERVQLTSKQRRDLEKLWNSAVKKYNLDWYKAQNLKRLYENIMKFTAFNADAATHATDIQTFQSLAFVSTTRFYVNSIIDEIAVVYPVKSPEGKIFVVDFEYANNLASDGINAGDKLYERRSQNYSRGVAEEQRPRAIRTVTRAVPYECQARPIEQSWTLQAMLSLQTIYTPEEVEEFLNGRQVQTIAAKLRDEAELAVIDQLWNNASVDTTFTCQGNDCPGEECDAKQLLRAIERVAYEIYTKTGVRPNVVIIGETVRDLLTALDRPIIEYANDGLISGFGREILGILERKYKVVYDPAVEGVIVTYRNKEEDSGAVVYTPFIPLGITPEMMKDNLVSYRTVYTVDGQVVIHPELIGRIVVNCPVGGVGALA